MNRHLLKLNKLEDYTFVSNLFSSFKLVQRWKKCDDFKTIPLKPIHNIYRLYEVVLL